MKKLRLLVLVKTAPNLSFKHQELVCTAGISDQGEWVRLYPIPFRRLEYSRQYPKYSWLELQAKRHCPDLRIESYAPDLKSLAPQQKIGTDNNWHARKTMIAKTRIYDDMQVLIQIAKEQNVSLATFKPNHILGCESSAIKEDDLRKDEQKIEQIFNSRKQLKLFKDNPDNLKDLKQFITRIPFRFYYIFKDINGKKSKLFIADWEISQLYVNCYNRSKAKTDKEKRGEACQKVLDKLKEFIDKKDIYFFLGTTKKFHRIGKNPFIIVGIFYPPKTTN